VYNLALPAAGYRWSDITNPMREKVPILLVIYNRPDNTRRVVEALRPIRPTQLFVAADGPRPNCPEDLEKCPLARQAATVIDWPCDVKTRFLEGNVGCGPAVSSAITWFFEHVEHGVILEDDCIPHPDFFPFCGELFERYAGDQRIMRITGLSPYPVRNYPYDYHFSQRFHCSGWGTWCRAWKHFSYEMAAIDETEFLEMVRTYYPFHFRRKRRLEKFRQARSGLLKTWAFRWEVACYAQNGLTIVPERNLITNIGFGEGATHTQSANPVFGNLEAHPLKFPLRHPPFVYADGRPKRSLERALHRSLPFKTRCAEQLRHALGAVADFFNTLP
jgi:hypothetical protein